jgi:meiotic recombination protein SPO11
VCRLPSGFSPKSTSTKVPRSATAFCSQCDSAPSRRAISDVQQGKGYPDLGTTKFLRALLDDAGWRGGPPPVFGLFDGDPDGINIIKVYRYGSKTLAQEHKTNIPEMKWLGVELGDEFVRPSDDNGLMELTGRDREKARTLLDVDTRVEGVSLLEGHGRTALQHMLMLNRKMEIQILEERNGGTKAWLERKLSAELGRGRIQ